MADLKAVYASVDEQAALDALNAFGERWDKKYPKTSQSWRSNWANLSAYFKYPQEVRRLIYLIKQQESICVVIRCKAILADIVSKTPLVSSKQVFVVEFLEAVAILLFIEASNALAATLIGI